ncbi:uncharacterized protein LOC134443885 isoform X2 [Engraulis encrasicolus]|uniref:uncharacterized protein LOC134443885 isoform X2 n=1 Tax=Engraulis encrasicolus TaxID=184585 RepID=UPI002FD690A8
MELSVLPKAPKKPRMEDDIAHEAPLATNGSLTPNVSTKDFEDGLDKLPSDDELPSDVELFDNPELRNHDELPKIDGRKKTQKTIKSNQNYCFVCDKPQTKITRHFRKHMADNAEIAKAFSYTPESKDRKIILEELRNRGNFKHNCRVQESGKGALKVKRRSNVKNSSVGIYEYCMHCKGMFCRKELWRHMRRCALKPDDDDPGQGQERVMRLAAAQNTASQPISNEVWSLLGKMHKDKVYATVRNEHYLLQFAQSLFDAEKDPSQHAYIRQRLRDLGRLLVTLRQTTKIYHIEEVIKPANFILLTQAVKKLSSSTRRKTSHQAPSVGLRIGFSLKKISELVMFRAIMDEDEQAMKSIKMFTKLYKTKWPEFVSRPALAKLREAKMNKACSLPLARDVQKLHLQLKKRAKLATQKLTCTPSRRTYAELARIVLSQVIVFNRRRSGEVSRITLQQFEGRDMSKLNDDISLGLTAVEKKLCEKFARVELRGKKKRTVAVILTPEMTDSLSLLVSKRKDCQVLQENPYLFAVPRCGGYYRGQRCVRFFADNCGAEKPESLTSTNLRKQIATLSQTVNLKDNELDQLADFLGHNIRVHREYYRLPQSTIQLAKISKLLLAMEGGHVEAIQGMTLDQIGENMEALSSSNPGSLPLSGIETQDNMEDDMASLPSTSHGSLCSDTPNPDVIINQRKSVKRPWTKEETSAVMRHMGHLIKNGLLATKAQCLACKQKEPALLDRRTAQNIRDFVRNKGLTFKKQKLD